MVLGLLCQDGEPCWEQDKGNDQGNRLNSVSVGKEGYFLNYEMHTNLSSSEDLLWNGRHDFGYKTINYVLLYHNM